MSGRVPRITRCLTLPGALRPTAHHAIYILIKSTARTPPGYAALPEALRPTAHALALRFLATTMKPPTGLRDPETIEAPSIASE